MNRGGYFVFGAAAIGIGVLIAAFSVRPDDALLNPEPGMSSPVGFVLGLALAGVGSLVVLIGVIAQGILVATADRADQERAAEKTPTPVTGAGVESSPATPPTKPAEG